MDHPDLSVSNFMENSIALKGLKDTDSQLIQWLFSLLQWILLSCFYQSPFKRVCTQRDFMVLYGIFI